jgi:hypothetical protein
MEDCMFRVGSLSRPRGGVGRFLPLALVALAVVGACSSDTAPLATREIDGAPVAIGQGSAHSYVVAGSNNAPSSIGVVLTTSALDGLPSTDAMWDLPLPSGIAVPPYDHITINWNAQGHPPQVYGLPHFDFHFYTISSAVQASIQGGPDTTTVSAADVPRDYVSGVVAVPDMGVHWVDTTAAEFHGQTFDRTMIFGFYHGSMVFLEPMITRTYLSANPTASAAVKQPQVFAKAGYYPTRYGVRADAAAKTIRISLDSLLVH